jgi:hypothetical protein
MDLANLFTDILIAEYDKSKASMTASLKSYNTLFLTHNSMEAINQTKFLFLRVNLYTININQLLP